MCCPCCPLPVEAAGLESQLAVLTCPCCTLPPPCACPPLQAEAAGLERELELARRQIDIERRKQEELVKERER